VIRIRYIHQGRAPLGLDFDGFIGRRRDTKIYMCALYLLPCEALGHLGTLPAKGHHQMQPLNLGLEL
jgi:hypothetical protein